MIKCGMKNDLTKFLVMDVDGTLTDGKIYMGEAGEVFKAFDVKDGCGIKDILPQYGIIPIIITARKSKILEKRCAELNITELYQGILEKREKLIQIVSGLQKCDTQNIDLSQVAYIGDDILDLQCMLSVKEAGGVVGCPADASAKVLEISHFISTRNGGDGAVREFIEFITDLEEKKTF